MKEKFSFKSLGEVQSVLGECAGKKVILRLDLNVPIQNGKVTDFFRIEKSLETLNFLRNVGAKIIVIAHLENKEHPSLDLVFQYFAEHFPSVFVRDPWSSEGNKALADLKNGQIAIVENIRNWEGEKKNDGEFAEKIAKLGDFYVNEAFSVSHREHASIVGVPKFLPSFAGYNFEKEILNLSKAFNPPKPYLFILGGVKFETKAPLIRKFLEIADHVFVGGALSNDLFRAKGYEIGDSIHSCKDFGFSEMLANPKLILPTEVVVEKDGKNITKRPNEVVVGEKILDSGSKTVSDLLSLINKSKFILWNGPLGVFEKGYTEGTFALAQAISEVGKTAETIVGGGDTLASIGKLSIGEKFSFVSTAGGAMLEFLANETLPGITALQNSK